MWTVNLDTNLSMKQKQAYGHGEHASGCQGEERRERNGMGGWDSDVNYYIENG